MSTPPAAPDADLDRRLADIDARGRRRTVATIVGVAVLVAVMVPLLQPVLDGRHHRHHTGGASWPAIVVSILVGLVAAGVAAGVVAWLVTRRRGRFAASPVAGLSRASRRRVGRTVRRGGPPSSDAFTRVLETRAASRVVAQRWFGLTVFGVFIVLEAAEAVFGNHTTAGTVFFTAAALMFAAFLGLQVLTVRGAKRYLTAVSRSVASSGSPSK